MKSTSSDLAGYKNFSIVLPSATNHTIRVSANASGTYTVGAWITQGGLIFPNPITVNVNYNFRFLMYGNSTSTANATLGGSFGIYRSGVENILFNSSTSDKLTESVTGYGWQYQIKQNVTFLSGDRIFFRLFLYVSKSGTFDFYYDSSSCPSSIVDPAVTRYFRGSTDKASNNFYATSYSVDVGTYTSGDVSKLYSKDTTNTLNASCSASNVTSIVLTGNFSDSSATYPNNLPYLALEFAYFYNGTSGGQTTVQTYNYSSSSYSKTSLEGYTSSSTSTTSTLRYTCVALQSLNMRGGSSPTWEWKINVTTTATSKYHFALDYLKVIPRWYNLSLNSVSSDLNGDFIPNCQPYTYSIRVWKINADRTMTEITSGFVCNVTAATSTTYKNATWTPTLTSNLTALCVRIYALYSLDFDVDPSSSGTALVFVTEDLGTSNVLEANQWNTYYHFTRYGAPFRITLFDFGETTSANGRIENVLLDSGTIWRLISTWTIYAQTRSWNLISTWMETLQTRSWNQIGIWSFDLRPPAWTLISTWTTYLMTRQWTPISTWTFDLHARGWTLISIWTFNLGGENYAFLIIPILFLCACVLLVFYLSKK